MSNGGASGLVSVITVNYNGAEDTLACLEGIRTLVDPAGGIEVIVVDNASVDQSVDRILHAFPETRLVANATNLGFAGGCNSGVAVAKGEYLAFINNDARPDERWLVEAMHVLRRRADVACVASKVLSWEGDRADFTGGAGVTLYGFGYREGFGEPCTDRHESPREVLFATGSALVVRADTYRTSGGFDDRYFAFFEDVDFGWRLWLLGHTVLYVPTSVVYHRHHSTIGREGRWREDYLLERNALYTLIKNLDDANLPRALSAALLLGARRASLVGEGETAAFDLGRPGADDDAKRITLDKRAVAPGFAADQVTRHLPELLEARRELQARRRRSDREIFRLVRHPLLPTDPDPAFAELHEILADLVRLTDVLSPRRRIAVVTGDPLSSRLSGPGIRALELARVLSAEHDVMLVSLQAADLDVAGVEVRVANSQDQMREVERWADVMVFQGMLLNLFPWLSQTTRVLVADLYDPFHLEALEQGRELAASSRARHVFDTMGSVNHQLMFADFFVCASAKQRDFWLGQLAGVGRINELTYDRDPSMSSLLTVVPFGVPDAPPRPTRKVLRGVVDGISADDKVVLWAGGLYPWFDPATLVRAIAGLRLSLPEVRLVFLAGKHPNPHVKPLPIVEEMRAVAEEHGLLGREVFFVDDWVAYEDRQNYLLEADVGVSTHHEHLETEFSFRTRILDYIWASLPIVTTQGDAMAQLVEQENVGRAVAAGDVDGLAAALEELLRENDLRAAMGERLEVVAARLRWRDVAAPLLDFCRKPEKAPDRIAGVMAESAKPAVALAGDDAPFPVPESTLEERFRRDVRTLVAHLNDEGVVATARRVLHRLRRQVLPRSPLSTIDESHR